MIRLVGDLDDVAFRHYLDEYERLLEDGRPYALLFDTRDSRPGTSRQRRMQSEFIERRKADLSRLCVGGAFIVTSPLVRASMSAILRLSPLPYPHFVTRSYADAETWAIQRLSARQSKPGGP